MYLKKSCVGKFCIMTMLAMEAGMIQAYANSPAPVNYRGYFAGTAIILVLTVLFNAGIETAVGAVMGVGPKWVIFLTNVGTNLVMNIILGYLDFTFRLYVRGYYFPVMCVFEILVLAAEYRIYLRFMGRRFPKKSILKYTAAANAVSFLLGLLDLQLLGMGVF